MLCHIPSVYNVVDINIKSSICLEFFQLSHSTKIRNCYFFNVKKLSKCIVIFGRHTARSLVLFRIKKKNLNSTEDCLFCHKCINVFQTKNLLSATKCHMAVSIFNMKIREISVQTSTFRLFLHDVLDFCCTKSWTSKGPSLWWKKN